VGKFLSYQGRRNSIFYECITYGFNKSVISGKCFLLLTTYSEFSDLSYFKAGRSLSGFLYDKNLSLPLLCKETFLDKGGSHLLLTYSSRCFIIFIKNKRVVFNKWKELIYNV